MTPDQILIEARKLVDPSYTPGQAFDAILALRTGRVTVNDMAWALSGSRPTTTAETDLSKIPVEEDRFCDDTLMPFGKYKGTPLRNVPISYLRWLWDQRPMSNKQLEKYISLAIKADDMENEEDDGETCLDKI